MEESKVSARAASAVIIENQAVDMVKIKEIIKKAEELDKKYIDYQVKIQSADKQAFDIQQKSQTNKSRLEDLRKQFEITSKKL